MQGRWGDCYLLSAMIAQGHVNPKALTKLIKENGDGTFDVTIHVREHPWDWMATPKVIRVTDEVPHAPGGAGMSSSTRDAMYPALFEKALAVHRGSYFFIRHGGTLGSGTHVMTGQAGTHVMTSLYSADGLFQKISAALLEGRPITASSPPVLLGPAARARAKALRLVTRHAYTVVSVDPAGRTIQVVNPLGFNHLEGLAVDDFQLCFVQVQIGPVTP